MKILTFILLLVTVMPQANAQTDSNRKVIVVDSLGLKTFTKVEIESEFPGGAVAWLHFLNEHFKYPKKAIKQGIQGMVLLQFIVDKDGNISDARALTGDPLLQDAALKVLSQSPKWIPATINGRPVKSYKKQPIIFKLQG
jgi:protein TonB